jgi:hypothetical protein
MPMNDADKFDADGRATLIFSRNEKKDVIKFQMEAMLFKFEWAKE